MFCLKLQQKCESRQDVVVHAFVPSTWEAEASSVSSRTAYSTKESRAARALLVIETLSQKKNFFDSRM